MLKRLFHDSNLLVSLYHWTDHNEDISLLPDHNMQDPFTLLRKQIFRYYKVITNAPPAPAVCDLTREWRLPKKIFEKAPETPLQT